MRYQVSVELRRAQMLSGDVFRGDHRKGLANTDVDRDINVSIG